MQGFIAITVAVVIAVILNKIMSGRIEKKHQRFAMQTITFIICVTLAGLFIFVGSLRTILDKFIDEKIVFIETKLNDTFPNTNILETNIDTTALASTFAELHQILESDDNSEDGYFEALVLKALTGKLTNYTKLPETQVSKLTTIANADGMITIKSILLNLKNQALDTISPYFILGKIAIVVLLFVYIGIYIGVVVFLKKGGALYNKSIVFGEEAESIERGMDDKPI